MQNSPNKLLRSYGILLLVLLLSFSFPHQKSEAATVYKTKKRRVLLKLLDGEITAKGDNFYVYDNKGRKRGRLKVYKVKGNKAFAKLMKGKVRRGWTAKIKTSIAQNKTKTKKSKSGKVQVGATTFWGVIGGLSSNTGDVTIEESNKTVSLAGTSYSLKALFDYGIFQKLWFRGTAGIEGFNISGASDPKCTPNGECLANINYLGFNFLGRYVMSLSNIRPWVGGGFSVLFPMSHDVTVFESDSITNTELYTVATGLDWFISSSSFIPISLEYGLFPGNKNLSANAISLRVGYGMEF